VVTTQRAKQSFFRDKNSFQQPHFRNVIPPHMNTNALLTVLENHHAFDDHEERYRLDTILFVTQNQDRWWQRTTLAGHITASAFVLNAAHTHALLLHHAKLNRWLQPGGHLDSADAFPHSGALREAREESGIDNLELATQQLFDVDVHPIPARGAEPAHLHYDVRYLVIARDEDVTLSDESLGFKWISLHDIANNMEPSLARLARRAQQSLL
jgi:8-oxo-dGTP pyrophosphatase MutT (NUDIX family)